MAATVAEIHLRPGFPEFVWAAEASGIRLVVVSSGVRELIGPVLAAHGVGDVELHSNRLHIGTVTDG